MELFLGSTPTAFVIECSKAGSLLANFRGEDLDQPLGGPLGFEEIKWTFYCLREEGYSEKDARALIAVVIITLSDERQYKWLDNGLDFRGNGEPAS